MMKDWVDLDPYFDPGGDDDYPTTSDDQALNLSFAFEEDKEVVDKQEDLVVEVDWNLAYAQLFLEYDSDNNVSTVAVMVEIDDYEGLSVEESGKAKYLLASSF